jgi:hypothetical protein
VVGAIADAQELRFLDPGCSALTRRLFNHFITKLGDAALSSQSQLNQLCPEALLT